MNVTPFWEINGVFREEQERVILTTFKFVVSW